MNELSIARGKKPSRTPDPTKDELQKTRDELEQMRQQLRETEQRFFMAEENARIGVWDFDAITGHTYLSPGWGLMLGLTPAESPSEWSKWIKLIHPDDVERLEHAYQRCLRDPKAPYEQEFRMRHASGRYLWVLSRAKAICDGAGKVTRLVGVHIDVTALKEIHEQMRDREKSFEELSIVMPHMFGMADQSGRLLFVNRLWTEYSGMSLGETSVGESWLQVVHPADRIRCVETLKQCAEKGESVHLEARFQRHSDGLYRWHACQVFPMRRKDGLIERWYLSATDVHDYKRTHALLESSSRRFQTLFDSNVVGIVVCDRDVIREANNAFLKLVGYTREELTAGKMRYRNMTPPEFLHLDVLKSEAYKKNRIIPPFEKEYVRKDGTRVPVLVSCVVLDVDPYSVFGLVIDLTERKRAENELNSVAKQLRTSNEELEHFAYVATHDLTEPTKTLSLYIDLLTERHGVDLNDEAREMLDCASQACDRLSHQVEVLTEYTGANQASLKIGQIDSDQLVRESLTHLEPEIRDNQAMIDLKALPKVWADGEMFREVVQSILANSLKFHRPGVAPEITIHCSDSERFWIFSIQDNGTGIPTDRLGTLFRLVDRVTAEKPEASCGIGLAICRKIIERHGGRVWAESEVNKGTTVFFSIPKHPIQLSNDSQNSATVQPA
jgi:PAS domain S-box-containing protein